MVLEIYLKKWKNCEIEQCTNGLAAVNSVKKLAKEKIFIVNETQLNKSQGVFVKKYFKEFVQPYLVPIMISAGVKFPYLKDKSIYLAVKFTFAKKDQKKIQVLMTLPL